MLSEDELVFQLHALVTHDESTFERRQEKTLDAKRCSAHSNKGEGEMNHGVRLDHCGGSLNGALEYQR